MEVEVYEHLLNMIFVDNIVRSKKDFEKNYHTILKPWPKYCNLNLQMGKFRV